jgi:aromatic ring-opening dioxygenase LigB subunit
MSCTIPQFIQSATTKVEKLTKIRLIIDGLLDKQIEVIATSNIAEYKINDGQVDISTKYNNPTILAEAIEAYEKQAIKIENQLKGRVSIMRGRRGLS